jgi:hypothetical protein
MSTADDSPLVGSVADILAAEDPMKVRDGMPTENEIRAALKLLQIPIYPNQSEALEACENEAGRFTLLLSILSAWVGAFQRLHEATEDPLDREALAYAIGVGVDGATDHDPRAPLNLAGWWASSAAFTLERASENLNPALNPGHAIGELFQAVIRLLDLWRGAHDTPGWSIGNKAYSEVDPNTLRDAAQNAYNARIAINRMIPKGRSGQ